MWTVGGSADFWWAFTEPPLLTPVHPRPPSGRGALSAAKFRYPVKKL